LTGNLSQFEIMALLKTKIRQLALVALVCWLLPFNVEAAARAAESRKESRLETPAEQTKKALEQIVTFDLVHHPLSEVVRLIRDQSGIHLVLDRQGLSQSGINPDDVIVSTKLSATVGSALRQILNQHNLDYAIIGDMVLITTENLAIHRQMRQLVRVRFDRLQLRTALERLARETATNLVIDRLAISKANSPVSLSVEDAPLEVVVKLLAHQVGLKQICIGNVMIVTTKVNAAELQPAPEIRPFPMPSELELRRRILQYLH